jgi:MtrB/PioB family decaheme-associated outer membrane protein
MRTRNMFVLGALLVASAVPAQAQETTPSAGASAATAAPVFTPTFGTVDFGYRGSSFTGDEARYNRLRDLRDGGYATRFRLKRETDTAALRAEASNVGYRDQRFYVRVEDIGRLKAAFEWNSNPLFQANANGLFTDAGNGTLTVADAVQQGIQNGTLTQAQAMASSAQPFDIRSRRDVANLNMTYTAARDVDLKLLLRNTLRNGSNLQSFNFGSSPGNMTVLDMGVPVDDRMTDVKTKLEWANRKGLLAVGYDASWYDQHNPTFTWDNPLRYTDSATAGPAFGRTALWPTNNTNFVNMNGSIKLPGRSKASATISYGIWNQNQTLLPNTTNTALAAAPVERASAETRADITSMVYGFNSRPIENLWLNARFRYYDYNNKTPQFTNQVVPGDYAIGVVETSEPVSFKRKTLDFDASFTPRAYLGFTAGYTREDADRTFRIYERTAEDVFRASIDSTGNQFVTARLKYEYSRRNGSGLDEELLAEIGEHVELRHYDIAPRDRDRVTALLTITPVGFLDLNATLSTGQDKYPDSYFGLRDNKNNGYSVGFDIAPNPIMSLGLNYGFEKYTTLQWSRTASPLTPTTLQFLDPTRDWNLDTSDKVSTISANLDLIKAIRKTDIRLSYDLSDGRTIYTYGLAPVTTLPAPVQYNTQPKNRIEVAKADVQYFLRANVAVGAAYWYEHYKVQDFAFDPALLAPQALPFGLYSGYAYKPYTANTGFVRMTYLW